MGVRLLRGDLVLDLLDERAVVGGQLSDGLIDAGQQTLGVALLHQNAIGLCLAPIHHVLQNHQRIIGVGGVILLGVVSLLAAGHQAQRHDQRQQHCHKLFHVTYFLSKHVWSYTGNRNIDMYSRRCPS